jgi:Na+/H+ antiporter NhaD/arsenite permease-like protein
MLENIMAPESIFSVFGISLEFFLFGLTLLGVILFHRHSLLVALSGLVLISCYKIFVLHFDWLLHIHHEAKILINLLGLLLGFAILTRIFEDSKVPEILPRFLPKDWRAGLVFLFFIGILSLFLDNIAAALIGATIARIIFQGKVHIGFLVAIVAASNAGGAGSVIGDTTTTLIWISHVPAVKVLPAMLGGFIAILFFGVFASRQQHRHYPITDFQTHTVSITGRFGSAERTSLNWKPLSLVILMLIGTILANVFLDFPALGLWGALLLGAGFCKTAWDEIPKALKGSLFLLCLVLSASLMPVHELPSPSWQSTFGLGLFSSVFDNIPLTKLAIDQNNYDWGLLSFAVGYGGSMTWFGSSAGVAVSNIFPEVKSVFSWIKYGWHVILAYFIGFFVILGCFAWQPYFHE